MILGVDPGLDGGLVALDSHCRFLAAWRMPTTTRRVNRRDRRSLDVPALLELLQDAAMLVEGIMLEDTHGHEGQSAPAAYAFGWQVGALRGLAAALGVPVALVAPNVWKAAAGVTRDKNTSRARALALWPDQGLLWKRDGIAEAALIARHGVLHAAG